MYCLCIAYIAPTKCFVYVLLQMCYSGIAPNVLLRYCPKCKEHRQADKQMSLWTLPDTLIIQLKRFSFRSSYWKRDKIDEFVSYPIK